MARYDSSLDKQLEMLAKLFVMQAILLVMLHSSLSKLPTVKRRDIQVVLILGYAT